ncbi:MULTISPECIES: AMP-dependent synthetase/ligase [Segatella]|jgi:long-chain acyl-CoA synthetase|uniref:AMP-binding family protein n=2 Tax=Segatella TaxID=2974251 RepID=D8DU81_9BACT|nr:MULTISPECIES: long-chain fatty acid--CoA ligase [Segatella]EFI73026.1 AMP-binding family protein [Segatella baroniae B14]UKK77779.1 long-chain fatty acid--CoA ligase [Segatella baroniae B14]SDL39001.1 long-chain acyl-CoA synthetase [Segatella bryantii]SEA34537.1 long-chain acyl-CoA synthetase [Segatella bryantii]SEP94016.1 long-chain acyl-CoA synthetase [Segatella baroniae B14]
MQTRCHLSVLIHEQAKKYGDKPALTFRNFGSQKWKDVSWNQFSLRVKQVSNALLNLGLKPQDKIAVFSQNCIQYLYTDFGAYGVRVISIPFYATSSEQQIQYMLNDSEIRILFVGEQEQYDKAHRVFALCPTLERIVIYDPSVRISSHDPNTLYFEDFIKLGENLPRQSEVEKLWSEASDKDICNILYTSGTTGDSKGVVLTYEQYKAALEANAKCVPVNENDRVINFLPFTHIFERGWAYLAMSKGALMIINTYPKEIQESMRETHPTCMSSVPRFWEKVYIAVKAKMDSASAIQKKIFQAALAVGHKRNIVYKSKGHRVPLLLELQYKAYNKSILGLVRKQLGLDHPHIFPTAGAYVSPEVEEFIHSIGINMIVGYGLTESLATVSCDHANEPFTIGSVGRPIDGIQIKIGENDEILLKGPTITPGYYHRDSVNAKSFDEEGFFHTGDAGYLKNGELFLKERIKDLFKTSNGKYIAPQQIEALLLVDKFVDQVVVIADQRKFVSALIVPDFRVLEEWAREHKIKVDSRESLCSNEKVVKMMFDRIKTLQQQLAPYEQIKQFTLLAHHFSMESGELTNTLKIRRSVIYKNFKEIIDKMYEC